MNETPTISAQAIDENGALRYLDASRVDSPLGYLGSLEVCGVDNRRLGRVSGVLIDPGQRRLRFYVVSSSPAPGRTYLLSTDSPACMDPERNLLRFEMEPEDLARCPEFRRSSTPDMSDDDLVDALFARRTA